MDQKPVHGFVVTEDDQKIYYDHYCHGAQGVVIIAHGFFNSKNAVLLKTLAEKIGQAGYDVLMMDFRGHGDSQGLFYWTAKEYLDLLAILTLAHEQYTSVGVIGFSLGAATSIITASKTDMINSLVAVSPPTSFAEIEYAFWEVDVKHELLYSVIGQGKIGKGVRPGPMWLKKDKPIDCVEHISCPTLFLHGDDDWVIRHQHAERLFAKAQCPKELVIIPGGPHAEYLVQRNPEETVSTIIHWFQKTLLNKVKP